jgi:4-hydroxybenzoate polyprenyltransferase
MSVLLAATAVYAFDRVKLADHRIDPADLAAQPERYRFLVRHAGAVRRAAIVSLLIAIGLGYVASPWLPVVIGLSVVGVVVYAPGPRGRLPRPKDLFALKNIFVAGGVVGLTVIATVLIGPLSRAHGDAFWALAAGRAAPLADAALLLLIRVVIDAILCDIDDARTDRQHRTATLPGLIGPRRTLLACVIARLALAVMIILLARAPNWVTIAWATVSAASALVLLGRRGKPLRDVVDVSFAIEALMVAWITAAMMVMR